MVQKKTYNIAIDGPSASGKSTLAQKLAAKLNFVYLDTGALYRSLAFFLLERKIDPQDESKIATILPEFNLELVYDEHKKEYRYLVNQQDVTEFLRTEDVAKAASDCSALASVRASLLKTQRDLASRYNSILDGRDIGTTVLPTADLKIFLTADIEERAKRRYNEKIAKQEAADFAEIKAGLKYRDENDAKRKESPLKKPVDAFLLDSTILSAEEVLLKVNDLWQEKMRSLSSNVEETQKEKLQKDKHKVEKTEKRIDHLHKKIPQMKGIRKLGLKIVKLFMHLFFPFTLHNPERAPQKGPALYVANHVAVFDIPTMSFPVDQNWIFWVNKKEVSDPKYANWLFRWWQTIVVDTDRIDFSAVREVMQRLKQGQIIGIYPQSTRIKTNERLREFPPRAGILFFAMKYDCPIYPVMIDGTFSLFKRTHLYFGKPFKLKITKEDMQSKHDEIGFQVMNEIFSLAKRDYYAEMGREDLRTEEQFIEYI